MKKSFLQETDRLVEAMKEIIKENPGASYIEILLKETGETLFYDTKSERLKEFCVSLAGSTPIFRSIPLHYFRVMTEKNYWNIVRVLRSIKEKCLSELGYQDIVTITWKDINGNNIETRFFLSQKNFEVNSIPVLIKNHIGFVVSSNEYFQFVNVKSDK